jgi:protein translocase, SecG subunit
MFNDLFVNFTNIFLAQATTVTTTDTVVGNVAKSGGNSFLVVSLCVIYAIVCVGLVVLVMLQTSKQEGLGGVFGSSMQNLFRGKQSAEQKIAKFTSIIGFIFVILSMVICFIINKHGI